MKPVCLFFIVLTLLMPCTAVAEDDSWIHEIRIGFLDHDTDHLWSGIKRESGIDYNAELIFTPEWAFWDGTIRPNLGVSINNQGQTHRLYGGGVWEYEWPNDFFVDLGLGIAVHNGERETVKKLDRKELGSLILFRIVIEAGYNITKHHRISLMFDHISNGYIYDPNEGLDTVGIRYGYRF